ncbi:hypothetical protein PIB30_071452, partial [Stylosanthes scabra]|nr:hypothetical protein [Stylosanthes scabra]
CAPPLGHAPMHFFSPPRHGSPRKPQSVLFDPYIMHRSNFAIFHDLIRWKNRRS